MNARRACQPEKPWSGLPVGRCEIGNEAGAEQPHASPPMLLVGRQTNIDYILHGVFEEIRTLKRSTTDFRRWATAIEQLRSELDDMKFQVASVASGISKNVPDVSCQREIAPLDQVLETCRKLDQRIMSLERVATVPAVSLGLSAQSARDIADNVGSPSAQGFNSSSADALRQGTEQIEREKMLKVPSKSEDIQEWRFRHSCWDAAVFLGSSHVYSLQDQMAVFTILLLNIFVQTSFTAIVYISLTDSSVDEDAVEGFRMWRTQAAQHIRHMDTLTFEPLVTRVCRADTSLHNSETQLRMASSIDSYLNKGFPFNGPLMCLLAVFTWTLTVAKDFQIFGQMFFAFLEVPHAKQTLVSVSYTGSSAKLRALSRVRFTYICILLCLQAAFAIVLLVAGIQFVVHTLSMEEILLNAVALKYILRVHELLFVLMPRYVRRFVAMLEPLHIPEDSQLKKRIQLGRVDAATCFLALGVAGSLTVTGFVFMIPHISDMKQARDVLCGDYKDFVYSETSAGYIVWSKLQVKNGVRKRDMHWFKALRSIIASSAGDVKPNASDRLPVPRGPGWSVQEARGWSVDEAAKRLNPQCIDYNIARDEPSEAPFRAFAALQDELLNESILSCADVVRYCNSYSTVGTYTRLFCPVSCGCHMANSSLVLRGTSEGCSSTCQQTAAYNISRSADCIDQPPASPTWQGYVTGLVTAAESTGHSQLIAEFTAVEPVLRNRGCESSNVTFSVCNLFDPFASAHAICPIACRCGQTQATLCPLSCSR